MKNEATINISEATAKELVEFHNTNIIDLPVNAKRNPVKKFADRKSAEKRIQALLIDLDMLRMFDEVICPHCGTHLENGVVSDEGNGGYEVNGEFVKLEKEHCCLACGEEFGEEIGKSRTVNNSAGIAKSWENPEVAAKRAQRSGVEVDGEYYGSVRKAYIALGLDLKDHIQFRMLLKENGKAKVDGRKWKIVPINYDK